VYAQGRKDAEQAVPKRVNDEGVSKAFSAAREERGGIVRERAARTDPRHSSTCTGRHGFHRGPSAKERGSGPSRSPQNRRDGILDGDSVAFDHVHDVGKVDRELQVAVHANLASHEGAHRVHLAGRERDPVVRGHMNCRVFFRAVFTGDEPGRRPFA
jgi:hypothetical protein